MIEIEDGVASISLPKPPYTVESLRMGALLLSGRAEAFLDEKRGAFRVELKPAVPMTELELRALAGEFLNECLSCLYRQELIKSAPEVPQALLAQVLEKGFPALPPDPLEQLEPQVRVDRETETEELLKAARKLLP